MALIRFAATSMAPAAANASPRISTRWAFGRRGAILENASDFANPSSSLLRSRPGFRFEARHPAFASADRGDHVSAGRIGQASGVFGGSGAMKGGWVAVGNAGKRALHRAVAKP